MGVLAADEPGQLRLFDRFFHGVENYYHEKDTEMVEHSVKRMRGEANDAGFFVHPFRPKREISGEKREGDYTHNINNLGIKRSPMQMDFHESMFLSAIGHFYKKDLNVQAHNIMRRHNVRDLEKNITAILTARRVGKTTSLASFIAAMMTSVEECTIAVFSTGARASSLVLDLVHAFILHLDGGAWANRVIAKNQETLWLQGPNGKNDKRKLSCVPSVAEISIFTTIYVHIIYKVRGSDERHPADQVSGEYKEMLHVRAFSLGPHGFGFDPLDVVLGTWWVVSFSLHDGCFMFG